MSFPTRFSTFPFSGLTYFLIEWPLYSEIKLLDRSRTGKISSLPSLSSSKAAEVLKRSSPYEGEPLPGSLFLSFVWFRQVWYTCKRIGFRRLCSAW